MRKLMNNINAELDRLDRKLSRIEPTLAESLANRRRKIAYHISNLRTKFHNAQMRKDEVITPANGNRFQFSRAEQTFTGTHDQCKFLCQSSRTLFD